MSRTANNDWDHVRAIFDDALRQPLEDRDTFVRQACSENEPLLKEVRSLLASLDSADAFMETPAVVQVVEDILTVEQQLKNGQILGNYEIGKLIGSGGMGEVYLARDTRLNRKVAIKVLRESFVPDAQAKKRLLREARATALLEHPNICQIYEIAETDEHCFIVMQYVEGTTLADLLSQSTLTISRSLDIALQVIEGLSEAHAQGIIHRDIKPANVIVSDKGPVKILDFGLAKFIEGETSVETSQRLITSGAVMGTVPFMSPEQLRGEVSDERSDIFSFGVLLYEMLGGKPAFGRNSNAETISAVLNDEPDWSLISTALKPVLEKCLAKDKRSRYDSVGTLAADLAQARNELTDDALPPPVTQRGRDNAETNPTTPKKRQFYFWQSGENELSSHSSEADTASGPAKPRSFGLAPMLGVSAIILLLGLIAIFVSQRNKADDAPNFDALRHVPVVSWKAGTNSNSTDFHVSHDGKMIAYSSSRRGGNDAIYIKQTSDGDEFPVTKDTWDNLSPLWSLDDQNIAFVSIREGQTGIYKSPYLSGLVTLLRTFGKVNYSISLRHWAHDGSAIFYEQMGNLYRLDLATTEITKVTEFPDRYKPRDFSFSPDETQIVFCDTRDGQTDIWTMPIEGGEATQITNNKEEESRPLWYLEGPRIIYNVRRGDLDQIDVIAAGGAPVQLTRLEGDHTLIDISPDGRPYYVSSNARSDIKRIDLDSHRETEVAVEPAGELWADPSPDGRSIVYQSNAWPHPFDKISESTIMIKTSDGQTTPLAGNWYDPRWLPDSRHISVFRLTDEEKRVWLIDTVTGEEKRITAEDLMTPSISVMPITRGDTRDFSPDGERIVYVDRQKPRNVKIGSISSGDFTSLTKNEDPKVQYFSPRFSRDGSHIAIVSSEQFQDDEQTPVSRVQISESDVIKDIFSTTEKLRLIGWSSPSEVVLAATKSRFETMPLDFDIVAVGLNGKSRKLRTLEAVYGETLILSPDGRTLAYTAHRDGHDDIWTLELARTAGPRKVTSNSNSAQFLSNLAFSSNGKAIYFDIQEETTSISTIEKFE